MKFKIVLLLIVIIIITAWGIQHEQNRMSQFQACCAECLAAFNQSPVGVGPGGARCGEFITAQALNPTCADYFKKTPIAVAACRP